MDFNKLRTLIWMFLGLITVVFDLYYISLAKLFKKTWGWDGAILGLTTLFQSLLKTLIYYFETIIIGLAVKFAIDSAGFNGAANDCIMEMGFKLLAICFFPLITLTWINLIIKKLIEIKDNDEKIGQINLFTSFVGVDYKSVVNILWLPSIVTAIQLFIFLSNGSKMEEGITWLALTVYFVILGIFQVISDYKAASNGESFIFEGFFRKLSWLNKSQQIMNLGAATYIFYFLLRKIKIKFSINTISFENIDMDIMNIYFILVLIFIVLSFIPLFKQVKKMGIKRISIWILTVLLNVISIVICLLNTKLLGGTVTIGIYLIAAINLILTAVDVFS